MAKAEKGRVMSERFFELLKTGSGESVIGEVYHWSELSRPELEMKTLDERALHVADDHWSWWDGNSRCQKLTVVFRNPLVLLEQFDEYGDVFAEAKKANWELVRKGGFDSIVYTPHEYSRGYRQAVLLKPKEQVLSVAPFYFDEDEALQKRKSLNVQWVRIQAVQPGPYSIEELLELEKRLMAHRYMYYVEADPILTDAEYDRLDKAVTPWLPEDSPLHKPGSDSASHYSEEHKAYAKYLRFNAWLRSPRPYNQP